MLNRPTARPTLQQRRARDTSAHSPLHTTVSDCVRTILHFPFFPILIYSYHNQTITYKSEAVKFVMKVAMERKDQISMYFPISMDHWLYIF